MSKPKKSIKQSSIKTGLYLGAILAIGTFIAYYINWDLIFSRWFQPTKFILVIVFSVVASYVAKKNNPQKFSFRDAFSAYFITAALGLIIFTFANYLIFDVFNPEAGHYLSQMSIEQIRDNYEKAGQDPEKVKMIIEDLKSSDQFSIGNQLKGYIFNLTLYAVFGAIVALIFKKKKPIII